MKLIWLQSKEWLNDTLFAERTCISAFEAYKWGPCLVWHDSCSLMGCQTQIKTDEFKFRSVPFDYFLIAISLTTHILRIGNKNICNDIRYAAYHMPHIQLHRKPFCNKGHRLSITFGITADPNTDTYLEHLFMRW